MEPQEQKLLDAKLSATISHAVDIKACFELFAYRVIPPNDFIARTQELTQMLTASLKLAEKEFNNSNGQLDLVDSINEQTQK